MPLVGGAVETRAAHLACGGVLQSKGGGEDCEWKNVAMIMDYGLRDASSN